MTPTDHIDDAHLRAHCKPGAGAACCRYLAMGASGWGCAKLEPAMAAFIDRRVALGTMIARGDNCEGRNIEGKGII
jgi:hypothetical protein